MKRFNMTDPFRLFDMLYEEELKLSKDSIPSACCLSTIGLDSYPNARFVSLKEVLENHFIITGPISSRKGVEILQNNKVAITFWWTETAVQVRIQGEANLLSAAQADKYFSERPVDAQIISIISDQGKDIDDLNILKEKLLEYNNEINTENIKRPDNWGGFAIKPIRIEFMKFRLNRLHERNLYELSNEKWVLRKLQP